MARENEKETTTIVSFASQNPDRQRELASGVAEIMAGRPYSLHFPPNKTSAFDAISDAEVLLTIKEAEILLTWKVTPEMFRLARKLKWIHLGNAGVDNSLFPDLVESDVLLTNASGIHGPFMAEWTLGALYYLAQQFGEVEAWRQDKDWRSHKDTITRRRYLIAGKRALIVGFGAVGKVIAALLSAAGVHCEALATRARVEDGVTVHASDALPRIIGDFDILIVTIPYTPSSDGFITREILQSMKPGSIFVNVARGKVVDEVALIDALRDGPLAAAALDVFTVEPLPPESPFFAMPNVFIAPHMSGNYPAYTHRVHEGFLRNLRRYLAGEPMENLVDKRRGY